MTWADLAALAESNRTRAEAWRCSKAAQIHREEMRSRDQRTDDFWADYYRHNPYPTPASERIREACESWVDVEEFEMSAGKIADWDGQLMAVVTPESYPNHLRGVFLTRKADTAEKHATRVGGMVFRVVDLDEMEKMASKASEAAR